MTKFIQLLKVYNQENILILFVIYIQIIILIYIQRSNDRFVFDLRRDPEPLLKLPFGELKSILDETKPKIIRVLKINKAPVILNKNCALKKEPYVNLDFKIIQKRAKMVRDNEKFCQNIQTYYREKEEEKEQTKTQEDLLPEETLYEKFIPNKDTALFKTWHSSSWEDKLKLLDKFQDKDVVGLVKKLFIKRHHKFYLPIYIRILKVKLLEEY